MSGTKRRGGPKKSAAELMAELQQQPEFAARQKHQEEARKRKETSYRSAASDLIRELAAAGFNIETVGDLRQLGVPYHTAVPILTRWLPMVHDDGVKEDIIRTLSVPWAGDAARQLVTEFEANLTGAGLRWVIGNALEVLANDGIANELIRLATDQRYGKAREMVVLGLGKLKDARVVDVLLNLLADEEVVGHAVMALGKLRAKMARARIESLVNHPKAWVRKEAKKALANIDKTR